MASSTDSHIAQLLSGAPLNAKQTQALFSEIMQGNISHIQIAGILAAMAVREESIAELQGALTAMRQCMTTVDIGGVDAIDIVGTGGDGANLFNVSTASAIVASASGVAVAKHGGKGVSSNSGAANLLQSFKVNVELDSKQVAKCLQAANLAFMFAPMFHSAMRFVAPVRAELKTRTIFNLLGPMCNPANVKNYVLGVYAKKWLQPMAQVLLSFGVKRAMLVNSADGLDEFSIAADNSVVEIANGKINSYTLDARDYGIARQSLAGLAVSSPEQSKQVVLAGFSGENKQARAMLALNSGIAIFVAGVANSIANGIEIAQDTMAAGLALEKIKVLQQVTELMKPLPSSN